MELSPTLSTIALIVTALLCVVAVFYARAAWYFCKDTEEYIKSWRKEPGPGIKKLTSIETELTEHADSLAALHTSLKKLRARVGMRENRGRGRTSDAEIPDPTVDPAGYKRAMRLKLGQGQLK